VRRHGLAIAIWTLALLALAAFTVAAWTEYAQNQQQHGQSTDYVNYLTSIWAAQTFGALADEFVITGLLVWFTAHLRSDGQP